MSYLWLACMTGNVFGGLACESSSWSRVVAQSLGSSTSKGANSATVLVPLREQAQPNARFSKLKSNIFYFQHRHFRDSLRFRLRIQSKTGGGQEKGQFWRLLLATGLTWRKCERREADALMAPSSSCQKTAGWAKYVSSVKNNITVKGKIWRRIGVVVDIEAKPPTILFIRVL